ncbi:hypothetical protein [Actinokineospora sp.]|uniref:hypothetical protein n=1 Tax=Actinokineospora sp. TaxID=1872133 RepID=UPI0040382E8B
MLRIELLVVPDCPHETPAALLLRRALDDEGLAATGFATVVVTSDEQAVELGFPGSPTIRIDGVDPFEACLPPGLTCRVYRTPAGLPDLPALRAALRDSTST